MGRGGRGGGHHGGHHFGGGHHHIGSFGHHHHHSFGRSRGGGGAGPSLEAVLDTMSTSVLPATLINGVYSFVGNEMSFRAQYGTIPQPTQAMMMPLMQPNMMMEMNAMQLTNQDLSMQQPAMIQPGMMQPGMMQPGMVVQPGIMNMIPQNPNGGIQQVNITIIGSKTKPANFCCFLSTIMAGAFCIIPMCFMCCMWWKKIVYPIYELTPEAYRDVGQFIQMSPTINNLNLVVADNAFNAEKAQIIYDILTRSHITGFTFVNLALDCNNRFNEADDFRTNVARIKSLSIGTSLTWGDMVV